MKIICVARNYGKHARELGNPVPMEPVFFLKPETALSRDGADFEYPDFSNDVHYELELVLRISMSGRRIAPEDARDYYDTVGLGIDFTARDLQKDCREKGLPWEKAKAFDGSAVLGEFLPREDALLTDESICFKLTVNDKEAQDGDSKDMIFPFQTIIAYVSRFMTLREGDLIFTGTPAGVGPVTRGDCLRGFIGPRKLLEFSVV